MFLLASSPVMSSCHKTIQPKLLMFEHSVAPGSQDRVFLGVMHRVSIFTGFETEASWLHSSSSTQKAHHQCQFDCSACNTVQLRCPETHSSPSTHYNPILPGEAQVSPGVEHFVSAGVRAQANTRWPAKASALGPPPKLDLKIRKKHLDHPVNRPKMHVVESIFFTICFLPQEKNTLRKCKSFSK